jgi:hypothetical protein
MMRGTCMLPASNDFSGYGGWWEEVLVGKAKAGSVEKAVARIIGEAERKKGRVRARRIARIRAGGRDDEGSTAYYAYIDGERHVMSKKTRICS